MKLREIINQYLDDRSSKKILNRLKGLKTDMWLYYYEKFNSWEFPLEFYDLIPIWWKSGSNPKRALKVLDLVMKEIKIKFSEKEQLRYHNVSNGRMTNEEFDFWYDVIRTDNYEDTPEKKKYYDRSFAVETIQWWKDDVYNKLCGCGVFNENNI